VKREWNSSGLSDDSSTYSSVRSGMGGFERSSIKDFNASCTIFAGHARGQSLFARADAFKSPPRELIIPATTLFIG
jgi:hypothetical protein